MSIKVMVLTLDGYDDWNVSNTEHIEVEKFNRTEINKTYFGSTKMVLRNPNPNTFTCMEEEMGTMFIKMS